MATQKTIVTARVMASRITAARRRSNPQAPAVTDKAVRAWARDNLASHDKTTHPEYTTHIYSESEAKRIEAAFMARTPRATVQRLAKSTSKPATKRPATKPRATKLTATATSADGAQS